MTPNPYPFQTVASPPTLPPARRLVKFGGYMVCSACNMAEEFCGCARQPPPPPTQGDGDGSNLNARIRDAQGSAMLITADDLWIEFCGYCGRPSAECRGACMCGGR